MGVSWRARLDGKWRILTGGLLLVGCYVAGNAIKSALGLIIPSGILGLLLLAGLLGAGIVRLAWVEEAASWFLWLLPFWLLPAFVSVAEDKQFWREGGIVFLGTVMFGLVGLWGFVGHLAQWAFAKFPVDSLEPGPLTEVEQRRAAVEIAEEDVA